MNANQPSKWVAWGQDFLLAVYAAIFLISINELLAPRSWAWHLRSLYVWHRYPSSPAGIDDHMGMRFASFALAWAAVLVIFVLMRIASKALQGRANSAITALVALAVLPASYFFLSNGSLWFLWIEVIAASTFVFFEIVGKVHIPSSVFMLATISHFGLWSIVNWKQFPLSFDLSWPTSNYISAHSNLALVLYSVIGLILALLWERNLSQKIA